MNPRIRWVLAGAVALAGLCGVPALAAEEGSQADPWRAEVEDPADPFAALASIAVGDLENLRGGDDIIGIGEDDVVINSFNTYGSSHSETNAHSQFGSVTVWGNVVAGSVTINGGALGNFHGVVTQTFVTAPGVNATAQTALSFTLMP